VSDIFLQHHNNPVVHLESKKQNEVFMTVPWFREGYYKSPYSN
jgi:hypothetical protein